MKPNKPLERDAYRTPQFCVIHKNIQTKGGNLNGIKEM